MSKATTADPITVRDPVGASEIAERLGVTLATVHSWRNRAKTMTQATPMPDPAVVVTNTPIWPWSSIEEWATATGRL